MLDREYLKSKLRLQEGVRFKPYKDIKGIVTIGVGHNLDAKGLSKKVVEFILEEDVDEALEECEKLSYWPTLDGMRKYAVANLMFNMGPVTWATFTNTQADLAAGRYAEAAAKLRKSKWYGQVGATRGEDICRAIERGE